MADYCSNKVTFKGENRQQAMDHFVAMGYDSPPFYDILIDDTAVYFESRWMPPQRDLNEIAELFDVSYELAYRLPNENKKEKFQYACMNDEPLGKLANKLRSQLRKAVNREELGSLENTIHYQGDLGKINAHERAVLTQLLGKKYRSFAGYDNLRHVNNQNASKRLGR